ncbi:MAG: 16S rRNA (guanine(527)-N(7))-methyltransferase RsmG [Flavobacteriales bacterium]|nr:16S rRNA (guanine(527)-N(7))-methyltransferase RsmG [Flavobacteriales bacterium]|tara:strand:+ start:474 stop:1100 length:627 start_codon:yes stop_codon:yes gene_type:complete
MDNIISTYFTDLTNIQKKQFSAISELYGFWNAQINVVSRKNMCDFNERHVLHSLGIAKIMNFEDGTKVLDVGTGGGFPGVPLAILFPKVEFFLVDSIGKKIKVVRAVAQELGLKNVKTAHERAENINDKFDFVVSRAVTQMPAFLKLIKNKFYQHCNNTLANGVLYLKGGDLTEEMSQVKYHYNLFNLSDYFSQDFFETKKVVYVQMV